MSNFFLTKKVEKLLYKNGWFANRSVDITQYRRIWKEAGYLLTPFLEQFISSFGGLRIIHEAYSVPTENDESFFDPIDAVNNLDKRWVLEVYQEIIKKKLTPFGVGFSKHMTYLMSENGEIFGGYDDFFCLIGEDIESSLNNIFFEHNFKVCNE